MWSGNEEVRSNAVGEVPAFGCQDRATVADLDLIQRKIAFNGFGIHGAEILAQLQEFHTPDGAQAGEQAFIDALHRGEVFFLPEPLTLFHAHGIAHIVGHVPAALVAIERMRRRPDAEVGHALPVACIVLREMALLAEVADLVLHQSGLRHPRDPMFELRGLLLIIRRNSACCTCLCRAVRDSTVSSRPKDEAGHGPARW